MIWWGNEGREKISKVVQKSRTTLGGAKQIEILRNFKTDTVLDLFEMFPESEVNMILKNFSCETEMIAFWLTHWDLRTSGLQQPGKSDYRLGQIPGNRAFEIGRRIKDLELRKNLATLFE